jgi:hypothetical protein
MSLKSLKYWTKFGQKHLKKENEQESIYEALTLTIKKRNV